MTKRISISLETRYGFLKYVGVQTATKMKVSKFWSTHSLIMLGKYLKYQFVKRLVFCYFVTVNLLKTEECEIRHIFNNPFGQRRKDFARLSWQGELHRHIIDRHSQSV